MPERPSDRMRWPDLLGLVISLAVLISCLYYGYVGALLRPHFGFFVDHHTGLVTSADAAACATGEPCLQVGDRILSLRGVPFETFLADRTMVLFDPLRDLPRPLAVTAERDGRVFAVQVTPGTRRFGTPLTNLSAIVIPLAFWLVGTLAMLFFRPRDERWLVFVAWSLLTGLWWAAGFASETHLGYSSLVFHAAIWLWVAAMLHLHLVLPRRTFGRRVSRGVAGLLYALATVAAVLDLTSRIVGTAYAIPALAAILLSLGLLLRRVVTDAAPALRRASRLMAFGVVMGCLPVVLFGLLPLLTGPVESTPSVGAQTLIALLALIAVPLWPLSYLQALHRPDLGAFRFRGNRLLGTYGFLALIVFGYLTYLFLATVAARAWLAPSDDEIEKQLLVVTVFGSLLVVAVAAPLSAAFQRFVDRRIYGIHYSPEEVVEAMAAKLPGAVDGETLERILTRDLLPTLLVRQSAIYLLGEGPPRSFLELNVPREDPGLAALRQIAEHAGEYLPREDARSPIPWVRLVVRLEMQGRLLGLWLLGSRDPDDFYSRSDIDLLGKLGNQVAVILGSQREMEERRTLQQYVLEVQKMEALGRLAAGVAHDFNNLLAVMLVATEMARTASDPESEVYELLEEVATACNRAAKLTKQLLTFSRRQTFDSQVIDLDGLIRENLPILRSMAGPAVELERELEAGPAGRIEADPAQVEQVLFNLTINAVDAMRHGGRLVIATRCTSIDAAEEPNPRTPPTGDWVRWSVRDTGEGIEPVVLPHVFEPFFTTKRDRGGTGLGLSLVYGIVQLSGGHTFVQSRPGEGACFDIYLPLEERAETEGAATEEPSQAPRTLAPGLRVLLVEDEANVRTLVSRMLRSWNLEVVVAANGREALEAYRGLDEPVDVLLTDIVMPEMDGYDLARELAAVDPDLPVLFMSGFAPEDAIAEEGREAILLSKPFTAAELYEGLCEALLGPRRRAGERSTGR